MRSVELLEPIIKKGSYNAKTDYVDTLVKIGTTDSKRKAFRYAKKLSKGKKGGAYARLGCMYRDGIGTSKKLDLASDCMRQAASQKFPNASG